MRSLIVNTGYLLALLLALPWLVYNAVVHGKYRAGAGAKFLGRISGPPKTARPRLWVHAVSVGEVALAHTILKPLRERWPQLEVVVSSTSKAGFALAQQRFPDLAVTYAPLDFSWAVQGALNRMQPDMLILIELELWPNLIWAADRRGIPVTVVNGRLSESSYRGYRRIRPLVASILRCIHTVTAAQEEYAQRFVDLGMPSDRVMTVGSIKFDGAETDRCNVTTMELGRLAGFERNTPSAGPGDCTDEREVVFVAGSTQAPEELMALTAYRKIAQQHPHLRLVVVPRHPKRFNEVAHRFDEAGVNYVRRTQMAGPLLQGQVLLVDTVGELAAWWGWADVAFVGGSMGSRGGQNMIEPSAFGAAVCFGPNTRNFREVTNQLVAADAARVIQTTEELTEFVIGCLNDPKMRMQMGANARSLVLINRGALQRTLNRLAPILDAISQASDAASRLPGHPRSPLSGPHTRQETKDRSKSHDSASSD